MRLLLQKFINGKGRAIGSLALIFLSMATGWYWIWGLLLLLWAINDLIVGSTWLSEPVSRQADPILFHLILLTWLTFGFYFLLYPFLYTF